jgi:hypothetical protein
LYLAARTKFAALSLAAAAVLAACGGGDGFTPLSLGRASGMWIGATTDGQRQVSAVTLGDGSYYAVYSGVGTDGAAHIGGGVQGTGFLQNNELVSNDLLSFSVELQPATTGTFVADVDAFTSISGTATVTNQPPVTFQARYEEDFNKRPTLAAAAGSYTGEAGFALGLRPATFDITAAGVVTSTINGCPITGTVTPRTDGNAYNMSVVFGGAPCVLANLRFDGIVYLRENGNHLYSVSRNSAARQTIVFSGLRQAT